MSRLAYVWQQSWLVLIAAFLSGLLMAGTNAALSGRIAQNKVVALNRLMQGLLPHADSFSRLDQAFELPGKKGRTELVYVYKAVDRQQGCVGWAFVATGQGFSDKIELIVAVDPQFRKLAGFRVLTCSETPGFGDKIRLPDFQSQFEGAPVGQLQLVRFGDPSRIDHEIISITGATVTSNAVVTLLNNTLEALRGQMIQRGLVSDGDKK